MLIPRIAAPLVASRLAETAAVVLLGPRQVGKTTLARDLGAVWPAGATYLDLERPADRRRLDDADGYLRTQAPRLTILDEVHRMPELFEILRSVIDDNRRAGHRTGQFLLLGSASLDLVRMSSESLAGRIAHLELGGIAVDEAAAVRIDADTLWLRGGFPDSLIAPTEAASARWREDLVRSYLEREVPMFAPRVPAEALRRLWTMVAHNSGGLLNMSRLASGMGVSVPTVDRYLDLLTDLGLLRRLLPWHVNTGKRVTKAPKIFVRDTGLLHSLLELDSLDAVLGHPAVGPSYESFATESLIAATSDRFRPHHYRTQRGDEVDLVLVRGGRPRIAIEIKRSTAPAASAGFHRAATDLGVDDRYLVHPDTGDEPHRTAQGATVIGLTSLVEVLRGN
jgi:predicted AAA+ superfamily ATPase